MEHLSTEILARLVDESPQLEEAEHLARCLACTAELEALRSQTHALASLPEMRPPLGDWEVLEARLRSEGLVQDAGMLTRLSMGQTPPWMRAAAAAALFLGGSVVGASLTSQQSGGQAMAGGGGEMTMFAEATSLDAAAADVRLAEQGYVNALTRYRQLLQDDGSDPDGGDPRSRFAALEYLVAASQAAVRQAPADPFLNGLLASTLAEREVTLRRISNRQDNWF